MTNSLQEKQVVTCFLESDGEILILQRSERVGSYQGRWAGVSGYIETTADEQAMVEIEEEISLSREDLKLIKRGKPLSAKDEKLGIKWVVHPYLFHIKDRSKIKIDWEHKEARWIQPKDIDSYQTVPRLKETASPGISGLAVFNRFIQLIVLLTPHPFTPFRAGSLSLSPLLV